MNQVIRLFNLWLNLKFCDDSQWNWKQFLMLQYLNWFFLSESDCADFWASRVEITDRWFLIGGGNLIGEKQL